MKTPCATLYLRTQCTNRQILTSANKTQFWPSTHVTNANAACSVKITSNNGQAEVIMRSMRYKTL